MDKRYTEVACFSIKNSNNFTTTKNIDILLLWLVAILELYIYTAYVQQSIKNE